MLLVPNSGQASQASAAHCSAASIHQSSERAWERILRSLTVRPISVDVLAGPEKLRRLEGASAM